MSETNKLASEIMEYLDCPCRYFEINGLEEDQIMALYEEAEKRGEREGFVSVIVCVDDTLWECLQFNADETGNGTSYSKENVAAYRKKMLETPVEDGKEILAQQVEQIKEWMAEYGGDMDDAYEDALAEEGDLTGEIAGSDAFWGYKYSSGIIVAEIPTKNPWEIFAWLPFGGWNECPDTPELMAISKYWYEQHGAKPAVITHDVLEYKLPKPVDKEASLDLAMEQIGFCPEIEESPAVVAAALAESTVWSFWWD